MQNLTLWLDRFVSEYTVLTDNLVNIVELGDCLLISEKNGKVLDQELHPILSDEEHEILDGKEVKNLILKFGSNYFITDLSIFERFGVVGNAENNFNFLKYFGKKEQVMDWPYLGVRGSYEILNGVFHYEEWVKKASFLGVKVLGICEKNTLGGVLKFQLACKKKDIKPIIGATYSIKDDRSSWDFKLYVKNKEGWKNLLLINSTVRVLNDQPFLSLEDLQGLSEGLVFVFCPSQLKFDKLLINKVKKLFSDIYYQVDDLDFVSEERDQEYLTNLKLWKESSSLKPVLICDSHYLEPEHQDLYDSLNKLGGQSNSSLKGTKHFKDLEEVILDLVILFKTEDDCLDFISECVENTTELSDLCNFKISTSDWYIPQYKMSKEELKKYGTNENMFLSLIEEGLQNYRKEKGELWWEEHEKEYRDRVGVETELITFGQIIDYFLLLWDVINFSNKEGILVGFGRGSAAGSLVSYLIGITKVDPLQYDLLFERFLTKGRLVDEKGNRVSLPDIDLDFSGDRRDEVKRYLETKYGEERVCSVGTYTSLQLKAAIKDLGRVKGLDQESYNTFVKIMDLSTSDSRKIFHWTEVFKQAVEKDFIKNFVQKNPDIIEFTMECIGQEKAASVHPCATIVLPEGYNIYETFPVRMGEVSGHKMLVSEWEGDMLEKAGFLKEDILGILQLTKFAMIKKLVKEQLGEEVDVFKVPLDVPEVMDLFCKGFSSDIFQFQSQTLTNYTLQVQPRTVEELALINAIVRPGPMDNGFHTDYVAIKRGEKEEAYLSADIKKILGGTKGLIVYQEQVMKVTQQIGGLTLSEADSVRRSMGKLDYQYLAGFLSRFLEGGKERGYKEQDLQELWEQMSKFCRYAYNKCLSGDTRLLRHSNNKNSFHPTISEMYKICNSKEYAKVSGHRELHWKYKNEGYGTCWSLREDKKLTLNKIVDIRFQGVKKVYRVTLSNGNYIDCTLNHKFPTSNGEKKLEDINLEEDLLYFNKGYKSEDSGYRFNEGLGVNSGKGKEGFQKRDTNYTKLENYILNHKKSLCEDCNNSHRRLEVHHIDFDHGNSDFDNLVTLCPKCHKKRHRKILPGEKGLDTELIKIESIIYKGEEDVYDVEMVDPYHTLTLDNGIVTSNSHAVCYGLTAYSSQYLKWKYPIQFWTTAFEYESDDLKIQRYISEIYKSGSIKLFGPDINHSKTVFTSDYKKNEIYWTLSKVRNCGDVATTCILEERDKNGEFFSLEDFIDRVPKDKVNKSVVENLIFSGAFDKLENIKFVSDRIRLIKKFRELRGIKVDKDDFVEQSIKSGIVETEWWWLLLQKHVSGFAFFNYEDFIYDNEEWKSMKLPFLSPETLHQTDYTSDYTTNKSKVLTAGIIQEIDVRESSIGEEFARILIENNYTTAWVYLRGFDNWAKNKEYILGTGKGSLIILNAIAIHNKWTGQNVFQTVKDLEVEILTMK